MYKYLNLYFLIIFQVFWFDQEINVEKKGDRYIFLKNYSRGINLKFPSLLERKIWFDEISERIDNYKNENEKNVFHSYANEKKNCNTEFFVDGYDYFNELYKQLYKAKETIYICGWWLSPELYLKRPPDKPIKLMDVLKEKAKKGIKINILIFKEVSVALPSDSLHTKETLQKLHHNIKVKYFNK